MVIYVEKNIIHLSEIDSTNRYLKALAMQGEGEGTAVVADRQTAGRGRLGRSFYSLHNGLYMSILLRPEESFDFLLITAAAGVAVVRAIEALTGFKCGIKWVNDIIFKGKKLCGILAEGIFDTEKNKLSCAVLGIGVNISESEGKFPDEIKDIACSLFGKNEPDKDFKLRLADRIFEEFFLIYENIRDKKFLEDYRKYSVLTGKDIYYFSGGKKHFAKVLGIDDNAGLIILEDNTEKVISSGEVTVRERRV